MEIRSRAARTQAMAVAMSLELRVLGLDELGSIREEILAGKEAKAEGEGGGGEGKEGKKGVLGVGESKGSAGGEEEGGCESWGKNG